MYASMHARLVMIAEADSDREEQLGVRCATRLDLFLTSGLVVRNVELVDGVNSVDDASIDIQARGGPWPCEDWPQGTPRPPAFVAIAAIAMVVEAWPTADECDRAKAAS